MIRSHIDSKKICEVILKLKRLSNLLGQSFGLSSPIAFEYLSLVLSFKVGA